MAVKRVMAHFMHETERDFATQLVQSAHATESFVMGTIDDSQIPALESRGLIVQVLEEPRTRAFAFAAVSDAPLAAGAPVLLGPLSLDMLTVEGGGGGGGDLLEAAAPRTIGTADTVLASGPAFYLVSIDGPLLEEWRQGIQATGAAFGDRVAGSSYVVRMTPDQANAVSALAYVSGLEPYGRSETLATAAPTVAPPGRPRRMVTWDVWLHRPEDRLVVEQALIERNLFISGSDGRKIRTLIPEGAPGADEIAGLPAVARMEEFVPPELHNDIARGLLGVVGGNPSAGIGLDGAGQIVAVADTGIDATHPDFAGRIVGTQALGRIGDPSDPNGHGTHVAGSILGDGSASNGQFQGIAPGANLYLQSLLDATGHLGGLPVNLASLFQAAYDAGARIHNDSWGSATASRYTIDATEVDDYISTHRDLLVVISAGNEGMAEPRLNSQPGFVDWLSIGSPASCKNALTVGARRSSRTAGGLSTLQYGQAWPQDFPAPPIGAAPISGDPQSLAAFSSRGPCDDRRIKPDIVAPGTDIVSTRSVKAPLKNFWGAHPNPQYAYMGGTSMAAPLVAGCAALVREYLVGTRAHQPSAALLKAILVNGSQWLSGTDAVADFPKSPNFHQGFGSVFLPWSVPSPLGPSLALEFADTWHDPQRQFLRTGQRFQYTVAISGGSRLRVTLAYTDRPARGLQNNLNLTIQGPDGTKWTGNADLPMSLHIPDPDNNVEVVRLDNPKPGSYLIQVSAWNILEPPQDFAIAVAGELDSALVPV